jgi:hypothetical protein
MKDEEELKGEELKEEGRGEEGNEQTTTITSEPVSWRSGLQPCPCKTHEN